MRRILRGAAPLLVAFAIPAAALAQGTRLASTPVGTYQVAVDIGPLATMLMPDQVAGARSGEVMVQMPGTPKPAMTMTDQGQPVNHHLEVHVYDARTGAVVTNVMPSVTITDQATSQSRQLSSVVPMYDVAVRQSDWHYGNNVYLVPGAYAVAVGIGSETATVKGIAVSAVPGQTATQQMPTGQMPTGGSSAMGMPSQSSGSLPKTGSDSAAGWLGLVLVAAGAALLLARRRAARGG